MPGYSLFCIEVIGTATQHVMARAAHQHIVIDAAGEKVPWRDCPHRSAKILKADEAGDRDQQVANCWSLPTCPIKTSPSLPTVLNSGLPSY